MKIKPFHPLLALLIGLTTPSFGQNPAADKSKQNKIDLKQMSFIGTVDERFQSFNVEMCEVIGGDFWIPYTLIDSVKKHSDKKRICGIKMEDRTD